MMNMEWSILPGYARGGGDPAAFYRIHQYGAGGGSRLCGVPGRQHYEDELAHPARKYAPPHGRLYLVCTGSTPVGCIALKALDDTRCEMKRLYVRRNTAARASPGALVHQLMQEARVAGYRQMVLDTFPFLPEAITLYKREGFYEIERYNDNPMPGSVYLCCEL